MTFTTLQALVSKTAIFNGTGVDVSAINTSSTPQDYYVVVRVRSLVASDTSVPKVLLSLDTSGDGATWVTNATREVVGTIAATQQGQEVKWAIPYRELKLASMGTASDVFRISVLGISANATVNYEAFLIS